MSKTEALPTTCAVAWGLVTFEGNDEGFRAIRTKIRAELRPFDLKLKSCGGMHYNLKARFRPPKQTRHDQRKRPKTRTQGTLEHCCKYALHLIDPVLYRDPTVNPAPEWVHTGPMPYHP